LVEVEARTDAAAGLLDEGEYEALMEEEYKREGDETNAKYP
jgi:PHD/YefM family antitoxin component YafN of YafNO toxin-antitoxin module